MTKAESSKKYYDKVKNNPEFKAKRLKWHQNWRRNNKEHAKRLNREWARRNPEKVKNAALRLRFNVTLKEYNDLLLTQNNKCAICLIDMSRVSRKFAVDHDHKTGKIRGLLCGQCNRGLGYFKDNIALLIRAKEYLNVAIQ